MDEEIMAATEVNTDAQAQTVESQAQAETKTYTQEEFDAAMAKMRHAVTNKVLKPYQDLGDPEELRELKLKAEAQRQEAGGAGRGPVAARRPEVRPQGDVPGVQGAVPELQDALHALRRQAPQGDGAARVQLHVSGSS